MPTYHGDTTLIWHPDESIQTFRSGLILATRTARVRKASATSVASSIEIGDTITLNTDPSLDGMKIFPAPERTDDAAFSQYRVSAYGRTGTAGSQYAIHTAVLSERLSYQGPYYQSYGTLINPSTNGLVFQLDVSLPEVFREYVLASTGAIPLKDLSDDIYRPGVTLTYLPSATGLFPGTDYANAATVTALTATLADLVAGTSSYTMTFSISATMTNANPYLGDSGNNPTGLLDISAGEVINIGNFTITITGGDVTVNASTNYGSWLEVKTSCSFQYSSRSIPTGTSTNIPV